MKKLFTFLLVGVFCLSLHAQSNITITSSCDNIPICNTSNDCSNMFAELTATATTDCSTSSDLIFSYEIDLFDDGSIDFSDAVATASGDFPNGTHRIIFTISDQCNTSETCDYLFEIKDCDTPIPVCIFGIATTVMPSSGSVTIFATDFESGNSYDNCSDYPDLHFSFSPDISQDSLVIECDDIPSSGLYPVSLYVTDEVGNFDFCSTFINIQDPSAVCPNIPTPGFFEIQTINVDSVPVEGIEYDINGIIYSSQNINLSNLDSGDVITPIKNINHLNGVTTYDLVLIQKHILNLHLLDEPWKLLAADVNQNNSITSLDIAIIRSVILQINTSFPNGISWVFDPASYTYDGNPTPVTFLGIKLGDVNGSASPNNFQDEQIDTRTFNGTLNLSAKNKTFKTGETFTLTTFVENYNKIIGGQFTIDFDPTALKFQRIKGNGLIELNEENFGKKLTEEGFILCSWNISAAQNLNSDEAFYNITFTAKKDGKLSDYLTINSKKLANEIYIENGNDFEFWNAELNFDNSNYNNTFTISPNPFSEKTTFNFSLEKEGNVELEIFDTNGRLVFSQNKNMPTGENKIEIQKTALPTSGIYFYKIKTPNNVNTGKIISQ